MTKKRRSYGGQTGTGIWWRKRDVFSSDVGNNFDEKKPTATTTDTTTTVMSPACTWNRNSIIVGWDDDLCRPIYNHRKENHQRNLATCLNPGLVSSSSDCGLENADDEDEADSDSAFSFSSGDDILPEKEIVKPQDKGEDSMTIPFVSALLSKKRKKTFGDRKFYRRPLSSVLVKESMHLDNATLITDERVHQEEYHPRLIEHKRQKFTCESTVAGMQAYNDIDRNRNTDSMLSVLVPHNVSSKTKNSSLIANEINGKTATNDVFEFQDDSIKRDHSNVRIVQSVKSSLDRARTYFQDLDKNQALLLDATSSPAVSSKVTRTIRRVNFKSPRIQKDYQSYAKASIDSGVSPLSIRDYASSRKYYFQNKREIFDGFLDEV